MAESASCEHCEYEFAPQWLTRLEGGDLAVFCRRPRKRLGWETHPIYRRTDCRFFKGKRLSEGLDD